MKVTAIRHGESEANRSRTTQGHLDTDLTKDGHEHSKGAASRLRSDRYDKIVSSTLRRCVVTTGYVREYHPDTPYEESELLKEYSFGVHEGSPVDGWTWPDATDPHDIDARAEGGMSPRELSRNIAEIVNRLYEENPDQHVLFVTHSGVIALMDVMIGGVPFHERRIKKVEHGRGRTFEVSGLLAELGEDGEL